MSTEGSHTWSRISGLKDHEVEDLQTAVRLIKGTTEDAYAVLRGKEAILRSSRAMRYRHRSGVITAVIPDISHGLLALVMVWDQSRPGQFLNGDRPTRSYWPLKDLEFTGRHFVPGDCASGWVKDI